MGSFNGHAIPGSFFLLVGFWYLTHVILEYLANLRHQRRRQLQRSWRSLPTRRLNNVPIEPWLKLIAGFIGICIEASRTHGRLVDERNNEIEKWNKGGKLAHTSMYGFFAFSGLVELLNLYKFTHFSRELEYSVLAAAFVGEGMLFYFHLHGRDMFDVRIHTLLYMVIFLTALVILLEACIPRFQRELFIGRTVLLLTQGTWFWEIAFTLYGPVRWFRDAAVDLTEEELMIDTQVVTLNICWHILGWCVLVLICCLVTSCLHKRGKLTGCCLVNNDNIESNKSLLNSLDQNSEANVEEQGLLTDDLGTNNNPTARHSEMSRMQENGLEPYS